MKLNDLIAEVIEPLDETENDAKRLFNYFVENYGTESLSSVAQYSYLVDMIENALGDFEPTKFDEKIMGKILDTAIYSVTKVHYGCSSKQIYEVNRQVQAILFGGSDDT